MGSIYLGVDIGTTSTKCLAVGEDGEILALAQYPYSLIHPQPGWVEQDPEDYWRGLVDVVRRCVKECKDKGYREEDVTALALSTQGGTLILTDESGSPLMPAISWMDGRAEAECRELTDQAGAYFWEREILHVPTPLSVAAKIRWITKSFPEIKQRKVHFCFVPDFLAKRLCGRFAIDMPSASWSSLFSLSERKWSENVLDLLGIPVADVSATMESREEIGELLQETADALGVGRKTKLIAGAFDQAAAAYGAYAAIDDRAILSCGTAWVLYSVTKSLVLDKLKGLCVCCHTDPAEWGLVLPFTGGAAYDWLHKTFGDTPDVSESGAEPLIFIPHLYGGLSPDWHGESRGSIMGLTLSHTREDIRLALMRGMAFEARRNLEAGESVRGRIRSIRMVGGAGKSDIWPQMIANILNRPVEVSECVESACYGAAKLAAGQVSKQWKDTQPLRNLSPVAKDVDLEERLYRKYLRFYEALLPIYESESAH